MGAFVVLGFVFPYQAKKLAWGTSLKWPILCGVGCKTLTQSFSQCQYSRVMSSVMLLWACWWFVHPCNTSWYSAQVIIVHSVVHDSLGTLIFFCQRSYGIATNGVSNTGPVGENWRFSMKQARWGLVAIWPEICVHLQLEGVAVAEQYITHHKYTIHSIHLQRLLSHSELEVVCDTVAHSTRLLWSPCVIGQTIIFLPCDFFLLLLFFPRLISAAVDLMSTILPHMVWP